MLLALLLAPVTRAATFDASFAPGFSKAELDIGGFIQPRFTWVQADDDAGNSGEIGFAVRRARLELGTRLVGAGEGFWKPALGAGLSLDTTPEPRLQDAWVDLRAADPLCLRLGQFKTPSTRAMLISSSRTLLQEAPLIEDMAPRRDIGAQLQGFVGRQHLSWAVGAFNGESINRSANVDRHLLYAGRVVLSPLGAPNSPVEVLAPDWSLRGGKAPAGQADPQATMSLGARAFHNVRGEAGTAQGDSGVGAELFAHYRWFNLQGEWMTGLTDWQDTAIADYRFGGFYAQLAVFPPMVPWAEQHLAVVARLDQGDPLDPVEAGSVPLTGPTDPAQERREILAGVVLFAGEPAFQDLHNLKLQLTWSLHQELEGQPYANDELLVATQFAF